MDEQNQNQINFSDLNDFTDQPMVMPAEVGSAEAMPEIHGAAKTELKDLEISFNFEKIELIKKIVQETQNNLRRINCLLGEDAPKFEEKIKKSFLESDVAAMTPSAAPVFSGLKTVSQPRRCLRRIWRADYGRGFQRPEYDRRRRKRISCPIQLRFKVKVG